MAERIYFYKLQSPYPEDVTLNCKLSMTEMDENFLSFKDNDINSASYDKDSMVISIIRNNGDEIKLDLSELGDDINDRIEEAISGLTPESGSTQVDIDINGELMDDGTLVLTWNNASGETSTTISGFLTRNGIRHDDTISGDSNVYNPLRVSDNERTGKYKPVIGIVDELPSDNLSIGDRYITKHSISEFGRLYDINGLELVKNALEKNGSLWRIPTKEDWDKLLDYADLCEDNMYDVDSIGEYLGNIAGKVLKSVDYWEDNENLDNFGFSVVPAGFVEDGMLYGSGNEARLWTDTNIDVDKKYIKGFNSTHDNVLQDESKDGGRYSIRLVMDIGDSYSSGNANIFGCSYDVINFNELNQAWISTNLNYNISNAHCEQYEYDYDGIIKERYVLNHWNGKEWEKKELSGGDEINVSNDSNVTTYVCIEDESGNQSLVKGLEYKKVGDSVKMVIDGGWF